MNLLDANFSDTLQSLRVTSGGKYIIEPLLEGLTLTKRPGGMKRRGRERMGEGGEEEKGGERGRGERKVDERRKGGGRENECVFV